MKRILMSVVVLLLTLIGLFFPMLTFNTGSGSVGTDPVVVTDYRAEVDVSKEGVLTATETVTAEFPYGRHGIFRFWDISDTGNPGARYQPRDISITMDNARVPYALSWEQNRYRVAKIGNPDSYVTSGTHVYVIKYRVDGVLAAGNSPVNRGDTSSWGNDDASRLVWRVVADGWQMTILKSQSTIRLPAEPTSFTCATNSDTECTVTAPNPTTRVVTTGELIPRTGVAVRADLPFPAPSRTLLPWSLRWDPVLGRSVPGLIVALVLSAIAFAIGLVWALRSRETPPLQPVMYGPPDDPQQAGRLLGPAQTFYVANEAMPKRALVATLFHLAEEGHVRLERNGSDWVVHSTVQPGQLDKVDPAGRAVLSGLGLTVAGASFAADGSISAGQALGAAQSSLDGSVRGWGSSSGTIKHSGFETLGRLLVIGALLLAAGLLIFAIMPASIWVLPLAAFAIGGAGLWDRGVGTRRTKLGREVWSRAAGFERLISTRSNTERLDFSARREMFTDFIPYAIAFDCADAWADKYRYATGQEPPEPVWFGGGFYHGGFYGGSFGGGGSAFDSFESSLSSSLSAYTASQAASSSGGSSGGGSFGGGFGGGGGGGGGGGSW